MNGCAGFLGPVGLWIGLLGLLLFVFVFVARTIYQYAWAVRAERAVIVTRSGLVLEQGTPSERTVPWRSLARCTVRSRQEQTGIDEPDVIRGLEFETVGGDVWLVDRLVDAPGAEYLINQTLTRRLPGSDELEAGESILMGRAKVKPEGLMMAGPITIVGHFAIDPTVPWSDVVSAVRLSAQAVRVQFRDGTTHDERGVKHPDIAVAAIRRLASGSLRTSARIDDGASDDRDADATKPGEHSRVGR